MKDVIYYRDFDLGDGEIVNVSTDTNILNEPYNLSVHHVKLIKECQQNLKKPKTLVKIREYVKKFPNIPHFEHLIIDHIIISSKKGNDNDRYENAVRKFFLKFPEYFFAKLHMARVHLVYEEYSEISNLYGEKLKLSTAFPNRKVFNVSEMKQFLYFSISYFIAKGRIVDAQKRLHQMSFIPADGMYNDAQKIINEYFDKDSAADSIVVSSDLKKSLASYNFSSEIEKMIITYNSELDINHKDNPTLLVKAQIATDTHPRVPHFKCLVAEYYISNNDILNAVPAIQELYELHPDFLLSKILTSELLLNAQPLQEGIKRIFSLFNADLILNPSIQKHYTVKEYIKFQFLAGRVWLLEKRPDLAQKNLFELSRIGTDISEYISLQKKISEYHTKNTHNLN